MKLLPALALAGIAFLSASALAAPQSQRVRGTIQSFDQNSVTISTRDGGSKTLMLHGGTKFVYVVRSSMDKLGQGDYIGVATKQQSGRLVALEVSIFPKSMSGMGEGHYPWDKLRDTTRTGSGMQSSAMTQGTVSRTSGSGSSLMTQSSMTNGTISQLSGSDAMTQSAMTNGSVTSSSSSDMGGTHITVSYNGKQKQIWVPASAMVVSFQPASRSALKQGAHVFIIAAQKNGHLTAKFVAVGKNGLNPPM